MPKHYVIDEIKMTKLISGGSKKIKGFTLVELVIVVSLVGILATFAVPSFNEMIANARLNSLASDLHSQLAVARSEAIKNNFPVTICASIDQQTCSGSNDWSTGWIIFSDYSGVYGIKDGVDQIIQVSQPKNGNTTLIATRSFARYLPNGFMN